MKHNRNLKESTSAIESAIAKSLAGGELLPSEIDEVAHLTMSDFIVTHSLDSLMAEKVVLHIKEQSKKEQYQSLRTWSPGSREIEGSFTRTHPVTESYEFILEDITDFKVLDEPHHSEPEGRMLDYGHVKSDSKEGRMMRQALYEMSEYSKDLHEMLSDDDDLPQWCHYKIAVARACVGKVRHYLEYKIAHPKQK